MHKAKPTKADSDKILVRKKDYDKTVPKKNSFTR